MSGHRKPKIQMDKLFPEPKSEFRQEFERQLEKPLNAALLLGAIGGMILFDIILIIEFFR